MILTAQILEKMPRGTIIAEGEFETCKSSSSLIILKYHKGTLMAMPGDEGKRIKWVAVRGNISDWAIYMHWADEGWTNREIIAAGDKLHNMQDVAMLCPATEEALSRYRQ